MSIVNHISSAKVHLQDFREVFNSYFEGKDAFKIFLISAGTTVAGLWIYNVAKDPERFQERVQLGVFRIARKIPFIANKIKGELDKVQDDFQNDVVRRHKGLGYITHLPNQSCSSDKIIEQVTKYLDLGEYNWENGFVSGAVYHQDSKLNELVTKVYGLASYTNPLHADVFPGVCKMEAEVVRMACNLFHGNEKSCGSVTTGGTESILMAMKACRDYGYDTRSISNPEVVLPVTAHPAFNKAAQYFGIRLKFVKVDPETHIVRPKDMARRISSNTVMLVASAPCYPYGTMDPVPEIAALGVKYNIPVHVDLCLGGFVAAFMEQAGYPLDHPFDFSVPGVTSISADTHKYGYAPKGSSVVLYSCPELLHAQFCVTTDWPGGVYGSPTVNGSRAGGVIATCWATMLNFGLEGYVKATKEVIGAARFIENELRKIKGIFIFGKPATTVIALGSNDFHIYHLLDRLTKRGWNLNPLQYPSGLHIAVTHMTTREGAAQRFVNDIKEEVASLLASPPVDLKGKMAMYGLAQSLPDRSIVGDFTRLFLDSMYYTENSKPSELLKQANMNGTSK